VDTSGYEWIQVDTSGYQWIQVDTSGYKWIQVDTSGYKWVQVGASGCKWVQMGASGYTTVPLPIGHNYHGFGDGLLVVGESRPSGPSMPLHVKSCPAGEDKMDRGFVGKK
jgi:hypothetical protein